ncbi:LANO_0B02432g1_1 [Lachancea nothofagi CBS 11611]|uniref:LANO_0B02432g1_1 n=1 Tax=Lachancea nothofagi CBS 11611 TaxID=1266666 RepID=A0A1G4IVZ8_9SACH|nr:LANO_0B02432g1_1 [Lachancea nothofagi CBS 11611]
MDSYKIVAPSPRKLHHRPSSGARDMKTTRSNSGTDFSKSKKAKFPQNALKMANLSPLRRPRSATPLNSQKTLDENSSSEQLEKRLRHYNLDYVEDKEEHLKQIYDPSSKWFCRDVKPDFVVEDCLPYHVESHTEQAKYLCHILVNLYIAICSLDIQGLISISSKDLADLKSEIDDLAMNTDMFRLSSDEDTSYNDIHNFDEDEDEESDEMIEFDGPSFSATGKITAKSATIVNVNHWANELKNCLHFEFPVSLRKTLASTFYSLSLVQGQKVYRLMHVDLFEALVSTNDEETNFTELLLSAGLQLDYKPMKSFLDEFLPCPDAEYTRYDISSKADNQLFRLLLKLAHMAKPFYDFGDGEILKKTMDHFISSLSPSTAFGVFPIITSFVPYHYDEDSNITDYFPFLFTLWTTTTPSVGFDTHFYDFIGCVAEDAYQKLLKQENPGLEHLSKLSFGKFGLLTEDQISFIFNRVQNHLRNDFQIISFSRTVRPLVFSIKGSDADMFFDKLQELLKSVETFAHPSNNGPWTKAIAKFVHGFIKMYHQRVKFELSPKAKYRSSLKLNAKCHTRLVEIFHNVIFWGAQNKNSDMANYYISCLAYMLDMDCDNKCILFDRVLLDLYDSLGDLYIHSVHRLVSSLKQFTKAVRFMIQDRLYRVHVTNLLSMLISKIDFNDLPLTSNIINCIVSIASFVPLENMVSDEEYLSFESHTLPFIQEHVFFLKENNTSADFKYEEAALLAAFKASTIIFENVLKVYLNKVVQLVDCDLEEGFISKLNQTTMIMIESMSDPMFKYFADVLERVFWENDYFKEKEPNYELITIPLGAAVRRDSKLGRKMFTNLAFNIKDQIQRGAGSVRSSSEIQHRDVKLLTFLTALSDTIRQSRASMLDYREELKELLFFIFDNISNPPLDVHTSLVLHNVLTSLSSTEVVDYRLFTEDTGISGDEKWGGLQFDSRRFAKERTNFEWHIPTEEEINFATELLELFTNYCSEKVSDMLLSPKKDSAYSDKLKKYILIITHTLSGSSLLFDADYNRHKTELLPVDSYRSKLMLLKTIRDKRCDAQELNIDLEHVKSDNGEDSELDTSVELSEDVLDEIHMTENGDSGGGEGFVFDEASSSIPSGIATPEPGCHHGGFNVESAISGTLAFRDLDIFSCNYFFGSDPHKKMSNQTYLKIQSIRSQIGSLFHKLFKFFSSHFEDNTILFKILLHGIKVWFTDVGQETVFNDEPTSILDMDFLENIQNLSHVTEPYTRTCLAAKAHSLHEARVMLHSTNRAASKLEKVLLRDVLKLSMSLYPNIFKPAQGCLVQAMKQLVGSYPIVMKHLLEALKNGLKNGEHKRVEVMLEVLLIKKIHRKIMSDYKNLEEVIDLLFKACRVKDFNVSKYADKILTDIALSLKIPSSVCLIDMEKVEGLNPADASITQQVSAVQKAKDTKRQFFISLLDHLQGYLMGVLASDEELGWKIPLIVMKLTSKLQSSLELTTDKGVLPLIFKSTETKHPSMIHLAIKNFLNICNKITSLGDCEYDLRNAFDFKFVKNDFRIIETSDKKFGETFELEMKNFQDPKFYIDSKAYVGYVAWGRHMKVVDNCYGVPFKLRGNEMDCLREFGQLVSKEWILEISEVLIQDNESKGVFSSCNIEFFGLLVALITNDCTNLRYDDLLEVCQSLYDKSDKASMILSVEVMAGLIVASKMTSKENLERRDAFLTAFLDDCLDHELNQDAVDIWSILCWWLPTSVDLRRCAPLHKKIFDIKDVMDTSSDSFANQASKISFLRNLLLSLDFRTPDAGQILSLLVVDHPYDQVRQSISKLLSTLLQSQLSPSFPSVRDVVEYTSGETGLGRMIRKIPPHFDEKLKDTFTTIESERLTVVDLPAHEILKTRYYYMAATMLNWVLELMKGQNSVVLVIYLEKYLAPFLMNLIKMKDVCNLANLEPTACYIAISFWSLRKEYMPLVMRLIENMNLTTSHELRVQLVFVENFYSKNMLQLSEAQKESILQFVVKHIYNENFVEVRLRAAEVLSGIIHTLSDTNKPTELIAEFAQGLGAHAFATKKKLSKNDSRIHSSVVGLGAVVSAFPYSFPLPKWIPRQLSELSSWARTSGMSGTAAKEIISDFKKVRADTWHLDRAAFTPEELEDLEGVLWRSYYA